MLLHVAPFVGAHAAVPLIGLLGFPIVFVNQLAVIVGLNGGIIVPEGPRRNPEVRKTMFKLGIARVPAGLRVLTGALWFVGMPSWFLFVFLKHQEGGGPPVEVLSLMAFMLGMFSLIHYAALRFVIPPIEELLKLAIEQVDGEGSA